MAAVRDIEINRTLLDTNFEGYKLDPSPYVLHSIHISEGVDIARPSDEQYSFLQMREFSLHNHLHNDPWNPASVYVVSSDHTIKKFMPNDQVSGLLTGPFVVWQIPFHNGRVKGYSNVSICFVAVNTVVISDGAGSLYILTTGDRNLSSELWKVVHCEIVPDSVRLADARSPVSNQIHCLLCHVDTKQTYLTYLYFVYDNDAWKIKDSDIMFGKGSMDYVALHSKCVAAYVIGQIEFKTQKIIAEENLNFTEKNVISFEWEQNYQEVKLWINITNDDSPSVNVSSRKLEVKTHEGELLLNGTFYYPIREPSVWNIKEKDNKRVLEIVIPKRDEGNMWQKIFESSNFEGQEISDHNIAAMVHSKLAHLTSETEEAGGSTILNSGQLEECDVSECDRRLLVYYDISTSTFRPTVKFELGIGQWLMSGPREVEQPPTFCLRSDVDGIVWNIGEASPEHLVTFCAFGFVQASKAARVFSFFPSDMSYAGLVDANGRVFIYRNGIRPGNSSVWGSQHIVSIMKSKVLGVHAIKSYIFILSENDLHLIHLNCPQ